MSLEVVASVRGEPPRERWSVHPRARSTPMTSTPPPVDFEARLARFDSATAAGVATIVAADQHVDKEFLDQTGFRAPLLVRSPAQLDLIVPAQGAMSLKDLEAAIGAERTVRAFDVATQKELEDMKLKDWMAYFGQAPSQRKSVRNLISLECTGTRLDKVVRPPKVVQEIGWVEKHWAAVSGSKAMVHKEKALAPKVRLYCLMSAAGSYTECHVDFGGSSVWYHLYTGRKYFFVMPPTESNLREFANWESDYVRLAGKTPFFGDLVPSGECTVLEMRAGDTMMLPSGWIHAVYTPEDSISFGGNFLSGYHMDTQLLCHTKEKGQQIEGRFFFPQFECAVWYAVAYYAKMLSTCPSILTTWEWRGLHYLIPVLKDWLSGKLEDTGAVDPEIRERVISICKSAAKCTPSAMLEKMFTAIEAKLAVESHEPVMNRADATNPDLDDVTELSRDELAASRPDVDQAQVPGRNGRAATQAHVAAFGEPRDSIARIATDDSSSSSSSSDDSSSDSSDSSSANSSDGEDTGKESDHEPPAAGDDDNGDTNDSSSDSSSDDDSSSSSSDSDNDDEKPNELEDTKEPQREEEPEEFDEPEESSSSDSDNEFDPESAYPDLPPVPVDALIAIRKRAKLKDLQITKEGKEQVIAKARQHILERQKSARSKKKSAKSGAKTGMPVQTISAWGEDEHWIVACSCGLGGEDYDDGREMVECNNCKSWVHIDCVRVPIHEIFWCFKCRASDDWLFVCPCGVQKKNYDDGIRMVQCEVCETWQHTSCEKIPDTEDPPDIYECTRCRVAMKKKRSGSTLQKKSKKGSKSKGSKANATKKRKADDVVTAPNVISPMPAAAPLPSPPAETSSPPPPPPPPPSAPPSPVASLYEEPISRGTHEMNPPDPLAKPSQKRKRGRPPLTQSKGNKSKEYDEDYQEQADVPSSPVGVNGGSLMMRPPLPITSKSTPSTGKRKTGGSARDRLEKKLKTRKSRG